MATLIKLGPVPIPRVKGQNDYSGMHPDIAALQVGDMFQATFTHRYTARLARHSLAHYARHKLKYQIEVHQRDKVLEIKRTA